MLSAPPPPSDRRVFFGLFAWAFLLYALTSSGRLHTVDEYEAYYMTESLVERGDLAIPAAQGFFGRKADDGRFYAPYGPLPAFVAAPGYLAGRSVASALSLPPKQSETLRWSLTSQTNAIVSALSVALLFALARRLGARSGLAIVAALIYALATPAWHYATTFFSEPLSAALLLAATIAWIDIARAEHPRAWSVAIAGLPLALMALVRLTNALLFPIPALAVLALSHGRISARIARSALYCAAPLVAIAAYLVWNHVRFGNPLEPGYPSSVEGRTIDTFYGEPFLRGLYGMTLSPGKGLFLFAPVVVAGLFAIPRVRERCGVAALFVIAMPLVPLAFFANFIYWEGGYSWGPRYLLPSIALWVLPLAFVESPGRPFRVVTRAAAATGFAVQLLGISVSFLECQVARGYYTSEFRYDLDYSALPATWDVFSKYAATLGSSAFLAEKQGLGFDRWFFFLAKDGFPPAVVYGVAGVLAIGLAASSVVVARWLRRSPSERPIPSTEAAPERAARTALTR